MKRQAASQDSRKTNPVAKHAYQFNRSTKFVDRKKADKRGYRRCKQGTNIFQDDRKMDSYESVFLSS